MIEAGGVCDRVAVRVRVRLFDALRVRVVVIVGLRVDTGVLELEWERLPLRDAVWVAGDDLDGVDERLEDAEEEEDALDDADDDAVNVAWGLRLPDFDVGGERVGVTVMADVPVAVAVRAEVPVDVEVVVEVVDRVRLPLCGGVGAAVLDGLAEEEPEEEALADDEGVEVGVAWGLRLLDFVTGGERVGVTVTAEEPVGVGLVLCVEGAETEGDDDTEGETDGEGELVGPQVGD